MSNNFSFHLSIISLLHTADYCKLVWKALWKSNGLKDPFHLFIFSCCSCPLVYLDVWYWVLLPKYGQREKCWKISKPFCYGIYLPFPKVIWTILLGHTMTQNYGDFIHIIKSFEIGNSLTCFPPLIVGNDWYENVIFIFLIFMFCLLMSC